MFPCTKCTACCRRVGLAFPDWGYLRADGRTCSFLSKDGLCSIYDTRPAICRIDDMIENLGLKPKEKYYQITADICNLWQEADGMPADLRVTLPEGG